jgi:hypothetical protein
MRILKRLLIVPLLSLALLSAGCDPNLATGFKIGLSAAKPFVQSLVTSGVLTQGVADLATTDVTDGVNSAVRAETCLKAVTVTGPGKRVGNAKCYFALAQDLRVILARHNLGGAPLLDQIATIVTGAIEAFEAYYTSVNTGPEVSGPDGGITRTGADGIQGSDADKQLRSTLEDLNKQLKAITKQ